MSSQPKQYALTETIAKHYGFTSFNDLKVEKQDISKSRHFKDSKDHEGADKDSDLSYDHFLEEKIAVIRAFLEKKMSHLPQPAMICYNGPIEGNTASKYLSKQHIFNLDIIGNGKSVADAIIIETAYVILKEQDPDLDLTIEINSIGDRDSLSRFTREFVTYYKKNLEDMPAACRTLFKKNPFKMLNCDHEKCMLLREDAPKTMTYLTEQSRTHFTEVLEYLESLNLPYEINHTLVGSQHYCSGTVFRIIGKKKANKKDKGGLGEKVNVLALGERYNTVARKAWGKKDIPAIGAAIVVSHELLQKRSVKKQKPAKFYFIQLGMGAKLKSLGIIEMLRKANIPVVQSLSKDKITGQLLAAEKLNIPYILLVGQKEAIEDSVTVRKTKNHSQETIPMSELLKYLKKLP